MTVKMLIDELNKIEDKNRRVVLKDILRYPFNMANVKGIEGTAFGSTVYIVAEQM